MCHHRAEETAGMRREGPFAIMGFTVRDDRIVEIDAIADPDRVQRLAASILAVAAAGGDSGQDPGPS